jgi:multisubunit Na+/H+ antiporter MnhE subunit
LLVAHGAGLFIGFFVIWACATLAGAWSPAITLGLGAATALTVTVAAARMGVLDREGARHFARALLAFAVSVTRWPSACLSAFGVMAAAFGLRRARSGFVRLKLRPHDGAGLAGVVETMSAAPGLVVVDADAGSLLAHALDEDAVDIATLKSLERHAAGGARGAVA